MEDKKDIISVFMPDNEPYLGRESIYHFDQVILSCLESNTDIAEYTHNNSLSDLQKAACQIIPQGINLALSIRELVRQGYLFAAAVLLRSLIERAAIISYLNENPKGVQLWQNGWQYHERPKLSEMLATMSKEVNTNQAQEICDEFNHLIHGDPISANFNLVKLDSDRLGYSASKSLNDPEFCDFICYQSYLYLIIIMARMVSCFPNKKNIEKNIQSGCM